MAFSLRDKVVAATTAILPAACLILYLVGAPRSASGQRDGCYYNGNFFSVGAISQNGCSSGYSQLCQTGGTWSGCSPM
jgi:hypothetical protein